MRRTATQAQPAPTRATAPAPGQARLPAWLMAVLLALVTMAVYWPATRGDFVNFDDDLHVTANVQVQKGLTWASIQWAWWNPVNCIWHPLTVWSHMLDCQLFGLQPWGHHLTSVLLHAVNTGLVFLLLRRLTGALWRSVLVAALFGWHPLHVESAAWVSERKDVLSGFFGLLALISYARYAEILSLKSKVPSPRSKVQSPWSLSQLPSSIFYLLSLSLFALGLMSKPMLVTLPFVLLLLDYWPLGRSAEWGMRSAESRSALLRLVREKTPFFALSALASVMTLVVQQRAGALAEGESLALGARVGNALISYCRYLGKLLWPTDLAVVYPHPGQWPPGQVLLAGGLLLGISVLLWAQRRRVPFLLMGWLWYCGTLVPVIGVVQTGAHAMADRYTYLPLIGALILSVWAAHELTRGRRSPVAAWSVAGSAAMVFCLALTRHQIGYWRDSETLFRHALAVTRNNALAHNNLGYALLEQGQTGEAIRQYQEAIRLKPGYAVAHNNLGAALDKTGHADEALGQFQEAVRLDPDYADAHNNLGAALDKKGQIGEAIRQFQEAVRLRPDDGDLHNNLGNALSEQGRLDEAMRQYQAAIRLNPNGADAYYNLGNALGIKANIDEAIRQYQAAIRLKPDYADARYNLGIAFARRGQFDEAVRQFQEVLRLKPDYADARKNLDVVLAARAPAPPTSGPRTNP